MAEPTARSLTVAEALARVLTDVAPTPIVHVSLTSLALDPGRRVLAEPLRARLTQPPFDASAMDGYAVQAGDVRQLPATLTVIGEAAAGHGFAGIVTTGEAVRIFTGAPVPAGADAIVIQENTSAAAGGILSVVDGAVDRGHIRPRGFDFSEGQALLSAPRQLNARDITLAAAMGHPNLPVRARPRVALIATGDELVLPGTAPGPDQIVCSNPFGLAAMVAQAGGEPHILGIARDNRDDLASKIDAARHMDLIVTIGGASVGDHDLVAPVLAERGMALDFWKIAMRPGKPMLFGRLGATRVLGLPGNPVSSLICGRLFLVPLIRALLGVPAVEADRPSAICDVSLEANGPREHYMRAVSHTTSGGIRHVSPVRSQDSALLQPLAEADCLIVREIHAPATPAGATVDILPLDF